MRYHFFLHYGWFFQNLGKEAVRTFMHTTVPENLGVGVDFWPCMLQYFLTLNKDSCPCFKLPLKQPYHMMNLTFLYSYFAVKVISHLLWVCYILLAICTLIRDLPSMTKVFGSKEEDQISKC